MLAKLPTSDQIAAIRFSYLTDGAATIGSLAELHDLPPYRVSALLKGPDFEAFRDSIHQAIAHNAKDTLHRAAEQAAADWVRTFPAAISKGDHRPMKDLLQSVHVIDPEARAPAVVVQIGISASEVQPAVTVHASSTLPASVPIDVTPEKA